MRCVKNSFALKSSTYNEAKEIIDSFKINVVKIAIYIDMFINVAMQDKLHQDSEKESDWEKIYSTE